MRLDLTADELLSTTRAVRKRLDLSRPVERDVLLECLDLAIQAPTGSNRQTWHWVVVEDDARKQAVAELYGRSFDAYAAAPQPTYVPGDSRGERAPSVRSSAAHLREHMHQVPLLVIPCAEGRVDGQPSAVQAGWWGSLLPAVWSFALALRSRGLGSAWTTLHLRYEREVADVLGIPYDDVTQGGLLPVAYTLGTDFKPAPRNPVTDVLHWDRW